MEKSFQDLSLKTARSFLSMIADLEIILILGELTYGKTNIVSLSTACHIEPSIVQDVLDELIEQHLVARSGDGALARYELCSDAIPELFHVLARIDPDALDHP